MHQKPLAQSGRIPSGRRFGLAVLLGHAAGAYAFCASSILFAALSDLATDDGRAALVPASGWRLIEGICVFPLITAVLALWGAVLMVPLTLLILPLVWLAARRLDTDAASTAALGALASLPLAVIAFRGAPAVDLRSYGSAAAAGAAFASIIWLLCVRPRRG
jgi:hypothetical protein